MTLRICGPERRLLKTLCGVISMSSLTNLPQRPQVKVILFRNDDNTCRLMYELKVPEGYQEINYQFMQWLLDDYNANHGGREVNVQ